MIRLDEAEQLLLSRPRKPLGFLPTPLHKLEKLSQELGVTLSLKRDDFTGFSVFGGNKVRKLEYLISDAIEQGCDTVFTFGATQSNHAMQTATACRKYGLHPVLYLVAIVDPSEEDLRANMLLDKVLGAEIHIVPLNGKTEAEAMDIAADMAEQHKQRLHAEGHKCYMVPVGGASDVGSAGFVSAFVEMRRQMQDAGEHEEYIFHSSGSGGTHAGLIAGKKLLGCEARIIGVNASPKGPEHLQKVANLATGALAYLGSDVVVTPEDVCLDADFYQPGYEIPSDASCEAIKYLARTEGLLLDPVYTGKAFAGMLQYIRDGRVPAGSHVVFWHTGGVTALFAEHEVVGDIFS